MLKAKWFFLSQHHWININRAGYYEIRCLKFQLSVNPTTVVLISSGNGITNMKTTITFNCILLTKETGNFIVELGFEYMVSRYYQLSLQRVLWHTLFKSWQFSFTNQISKWPYITAVQILSSQQQLN